MPSLSLAPLPVAGLDLRLLLDVGGPVLVAILVLSGCLWMLILERYWFVYRVQQQRLHAAQLKWDARADQRSWFARGVLHGLRSELKLELSSHLKLIDSLIAVLPMVGLLGTVTGMVSAFDSLAVTGSGDIRNLAEGVSQALFTTTAGLLTALSGMYFAKHLRNAVERAELRLLDALQFKSKA